MSTTLIKKVYKCINNIQFWLLPGICIICNRSSSAHKDICQSCVSQLPTLHKPCSSCALPLPTGYREQHCGACLSQAPPFRYMVSAFEYSSPINTLISNFKDHGQLYSGRVLAGQLEHTLRLFYQNKAYPQLIIPVPLHKRRLRQRGFNQAAVLSHHLSRKLAIPVNSSFCARIQDNPAQRGLSAKKRRLNILDAFKLSPTTSLRNTTCIALIDDVVTTGSTVSELSKLLLKHGVQEVHIWSLARVCK